MIPDKTFLRFVAVGMINTLIGYSIIFVLYNIIQIDYRYAYFFSYVIGVIISFFLNRQFVFFSQKNKLKEFIKFLFAFILSYLVSYLALNMMVENNPLYTNIAFLISMILYSLIFYLLNRYVIFT